MTYTVDHGAADKLNKAFNLLETGPLKDNLSVLTLEDRASTDNTDAVYQTSLERLQDIQNSNKDKEHAIAVDGKFHILKLSGQFFRALLKGVADIYPNTPLMMSGKFLYKGPGSYMGWHTNINTPTMRTYASYCPKEEGKSFFRYQDPETKEIITSHDPKGWCVRRFTVTEENPLWHCVYSDTSRFSFGFRVYK